MLAGLLLLLPSPHGRSIGERWWLGADHARDARPVGAPTREAVAACPHGLGPIGGVAQDANERGLFELHGIDGQSIGWAARTLPAAEGIAGYRGPTEALLVLDVQQTIVGVGILTSHDTEEHVDEVRRDTAFFAQFIGLSWGGKTRGGKNAPIDGVTGATLTSLAMARGILERLGHDTRSLIFDRPLNLADARKVFPGSGAMDGDPVAVVFGDASDADSRLGTLVRTGAFVDDEIGYQGPTEMLLGFDVDGVLVQMSVRQSFDNEPYVGYVPQEASFWKSFTGKTISDLASMDMQDAGIEGVSGATMTSMSIAHCLPRVAETIQAAGNGGEPKSNDPSGFEDARVFDVWTKPVASSGWSGWIEGGVRQIQWSVGDTITLGLLLALAVLSWTRQFRRRTVRWIWLVVVVIGLGAWTGNLVSLALIAGWATSGASWYLAVGLVALVAVALIVPPTRRGNPYCNHLCPHGAVQQLIRPGSRSRRKWTSPVLTRPWLARLPAATLAVAYLVLLVRPQSDVSVFEPFHAYLWSIASSTAIAFAIATLVGSAFVPMGYCRLGCPTGRLLEHIRLKTSSARWTRFDGGVLILLLVGVVTRVVAGVVDGAIAE